MKKLELSQMEGLEGGLAPRDWSCAMSGLAAGIAAGCNPLVGGLVTAACYLY